MSGKWDDLAYLLHDVRWQEPEVVAHFLAVVGRRVPLQVREQIHPLHNPVAAGLPASVLTAVAQEWEEDAAALVRVLDQLDTESAGRALLDGCRIICTRHARRLRTLVQDVAGC